MIEQKNKLSLLALPHFSFHPSLITGHVVRESQPETFSVLCIGARYQADKFSKKVRATALQDDPDVVAFIVIRTRRMIHSLFSFC